MKLTKHDLKLAQVISEYYGLKLKYNTKISTSIGKAEIFNNKIIVNYKTCKNDIRLFYSVLFHEIAHFDCNAEIRQSQNKFYSSKPFHFVNLMLKEEYATEKRARKLFREWFPKLKYIGSYNNKSLDLVYLAVYYYKDCWK